MFRVASMTDTVRTVRESCAVPFAGADSGRACLLFLACVTGCYPVRAAFAARVSALLSLLEDSYGVFAEARAQLSMAVAYFSDVDV